MAHAWARALSNTRQDTGPATNVPSRSLTPNVRAKGLDPAQETGENQ